MKPLISTKIALSNAEKILDDTVRKKRPHSFIDTVKPLRFTPAYFLEEQIQACFKEELSN